MTNPIATHKIGTSKSDGTQFATRVRVRAGNKVPKIERTSESG